MPFILHILVVTLAAVRTRTNPDIKHSKAHAPNASALQKANILGLSLSCCKSLQLLCPCSSPCSLSSTITKQTEEVSWQTQTE